MINFLKNKPIDDHDRFFFSLEKLVNIALSKIERNENQSVKKILKTIENIFHQFLELNKANPKKFKALLLSRDFYGNYYNPTEKPNKLDHTDFANVKSEDQQRREAEYLLRIGKGNQLKGITKFMDSFEKLWTGAIKYDNNEISRYVIYHLIWILRDLSYGESNESFIKLLLGMLNNLSFKAISKSKNGLDLSIHAASIHWYTDIVFDRLSDSGKFNIRYLDIYDTHFFNSAKYIIEYNRTKLFKSLVSSLVDGIYLPIYDTGKIWEYGHFLLHLEPQKWDTINANSKIENQIKIISEIQKNLSTYEDLVRVMEKYDLLKNMLEPNYTKEQKNTALILEEDVKGYFTGMYKSNNLFALMFAIGAYSLFKNRPHFIKIMWEYKQPPDSDASWGGNDIFPTSIDKLLILFYAQIRNKKIIDFWEGHHGSEGYYEKYFILLLAHILEKDQNAIEYALPPLNTVQYQSICDLSERYINVVDLISKDQELLKILYYREYSKSSLFKDNLTSFFNNLNEKSLQKLQKYEQEEHISPEKVTEFFGDVIKEHNKSANIRAIMKKLDLFDDKITDKYENGIERIGINTIDRKTAFFEEWYASYLGWGENYGRNIALAEDRQLARIIVKSCNNPGTKEFDELIQLIKPAENIIIFSETKVIFDYLFKQKEFMPKWRMKSDPMELSEINGFQGYYSYKNNWIPIFEIHLSSQRKKVCIVNRHKFGTFIQYSPLNTGEVESERINLFYAKVKEFSADEELMKEFILKPPEWLKEIGNEEKQKEYLSENVLINIFQRFEIKLEDDFEGYVINIQI